MSVVANPNTFIKGLDRSVTRFERQFSNKVRLLMHEAHRRLMARTPVYSGQAVRNYIATEGAPYTGPALPGMDPVEQTNPLPLGAERLRPAAQRAAEASLRTLSFKDPFKTYYITNRAPHIAGLEAGELPEDPYVPRSPLGMFAVTLQELVNLLDSGRF